MSEGSGSSHSRMTERPGGAANAEPLKSGRLFTRLRSMLGLRGEGDVRDAIEELIEERRDEPEASIDPDERELLKNILSLREVTVYDVMVPRAHIIAVPVTTPFADLVALMATDSHSRMPVYREKLDDVVGMVHIKDVLAAIHAGRSSGDLEALLRKVLFVPPTMRAFECLVQMRTNRIHLALVVDEYGGIDGLVTIEDVVEQIVGEIQDEHDDEEIMLVEPRPDGSLLVDAGLTLKELEQRIGDFLSEHEREEADTVGGLVATLLGKVPAVGESFTHGSGISFEVVDGDPRRIARLVLRNLPDREPADG